MSRSSLQEQSGRLFKPLAFTKTYAMGAAALLSITIAPVLMGWFIRGKIRPEHANPINRLLIRIFHPVVDLVLKWRMATLALALAAMLSINWALSGWVRSSCLPCTKAISCTCPPPCLACR